MCIVICFIYTVDEWKHSTIPCICKFWSLNLPKFLNLGRETHSWKPSLGTSPLDKSLPLAAWSWSQPFWSKKKQLFWGMAHRAPSPNPTSLYLGLCPWFGLCPQCHKFASQKFRPGCASETRLWHRHAIFNLFNGDTPNSSQVDGLRGRRGRSGYRAPQLYLA